MSEYSNVEQPFLNKLRQLDWDVIDHGSGFIPQDLSVSKRTSFREAILKQEFRDSLKRINLTEDGRQWLTDKQIDDVEREVTTQPGLGLLEANNNIFDLLTKNTAASINELTGEQSPLVRLVDFRNPDRSSFIAINQFSIDTPGASRSAIIPDIVLFVSGLPLVVIECKDIDVAEPLSEALFR